MWKIRELCVKGVKCIPQGYLLYGKISDRLYKFLIKDNIVLVESDDGWKLLPKRISRFVASKLSLFHFGVAPPSG